MLSAFTLRRPPWAEPSRGSSGCRRAYINGFFEWSSLSTRLATQRVKRLPATLASKQEKLLPRLCTSDGPHDRSIPKALAGPSLADSRERNVSPSEAACAGTQKGTLRGECQIDDGRGADARLSSDTSRTVRRCALVKPHHSSSPCSEMMYQIRILRELSSVRISDQKIGCPVS